MKRLTPFLLVCLFAASVGALTPDEWRFSQTIDLSKAGLTRVNLPPETIDAARPNLEDIRVLDAAGAEVPFLIDRPAPKRESSVRAKELRTELLPGATQITLTTGTKSPLKGVTLQAPAEAEFIKPVKVGGSPDGKGWRQITNAQPIFRMKGGAENLRVSFTEGAWDFVRLTIDDSKATAVPFTGVLLDLAEEKAPVEPVTATIKARDESPGSTRISLDLGAANLSIAAVRIDAADPLFARAIIVAVPELANENVREQVLCTGSIYRLDVTGKPESRLEVPVNAQVRSRELILVIQNGDSPPLKINAVQIDRRPARLVFLAREPGRYRLLAGNEQYPAPNYDLSGMAEQLKTAAANEVRPSSLVANAGYQAPDTLAGVPLTGAKIDISGWKFRRRIETPKAGTQQVELDAEILAHSSPDQRDLRIVTDDRQLPFLLERTSISRSVPLKADAANDPKRPTLSRWSLKLSQAGTPITRIRCTAGTALFQRDMRLWEDVADERGDTSSHELGRANWKQTPDQKRNEFVIVLDSAPKSDTLYLETDNGDNPAVELRDFAGFYPVTRAIFKTAESGGSVWIYYGNPDAPAPRYDLSLIAGQLLREDRAAATLARLERTDSTMDRLSSSLTGSARYIFFGVLAVVVVALLVLISRLLPKPQ